MAQRTWTAAEVRALGLHTDVPNAGSILGIGRTAAYDLVRRGQFPVPVIKLGRKLVVPTEPLLALLGAADQAPSCQSDD